VINLWEVNAETVFEQSLDTLLPLVPILKDGGNQQTVRRALVQLYQFNKFLQHVFEHLPLPRGGWEGSGLWHFKSTLVLQRNEELEFLLGFFASFVLDTELVRQIMRWDMTVLRESPWYQELLQEGERSLALRQLTRRLGTLPKRIVSVILAI
jgi:hypothetical protein